MRRLVRSRARSSVLEHAARGPILAPGARPSRLAAARAAMLGEARPPPWASRVLSGAVFIDLSKGLDMADRAPPCSN